MKTRLFDHKLKAVVARLAGGHKHLSFVAAMIVTLVLVGTVAASVNFVLKWGGPGSGDGEFYVAGVAADASSHIYVADLFNHRIQKFDANGNFISKWGSFGSSDGQFYYPYGVSVDASSNVYVAIMAKQVDASFER